MMIHCGNPRNVPRATVALARVIISTSRNVRMSITTTTTTTSLAKVGSVENSERFRHRQSTIVSTIDNSNNNSNNNKNIMVKLQRQSFSSEVNKSGAIGDYIGSLRLKAANALASSLPNEERNQLLERLGTTTTTTTDSHPDGDTVAEEEGISGEEEEDAPLSYQLSIDEAVAAARAKEAARYAEKWEREKDQLLLEAETAARRRVQSDLEIQRRAIAFEAWKENLEREKTAEANAMAAAVTASTETSSKMGESTVEEILGEHPILGPVISDLGYKRIHLTSSRALAAIPVWKKQRIYRHGRAKSMAKDKMKTLHLGLPGVIGIFESTDGDLQIIDGQHRIGMLKVLEENEGTAEFEFDKILVEVYPPKVGVDEESHAKDLFLEVNKAEPVKLVDLPGMAKAADRKVINEGADRLQERFPDMFSPSQRCRSPHLNIDNLRDALFASNVIQKHSLKTPKALEDWMMGQNEMLATKFQAEENRLLVPASALKKAEKYDFYLGLDSSWFYN